MKTFANIVKWLFITVLGGLFLKSLRFTWQLSGVFVRALWVTIKYMALFLLWLLYFLSRLLTWPFRKCFPPKSIDSMSGIDFGRFVSKWLALEGYRSIRTTKISSDYGVDITAYRDGVSIGVQCKRYSGKVGVAAIQEITAGLPYYGCEKGLVITNSVFTQNAQELALSNGIELIDGEQLKASRAGKTLVRSYFSMLMSTLVMAITSAAILGLNIWVLFRAKDFLPLTLMLFSICLLCLINGIYELKDRSKKDIEFEEELDSFEAENPDLPDYFNQY